MYWEAGIVIIKKYEPLFEKYIISTLSCFEDYMKETCCLQFSIYFKDQGIYSNFLIFELIDVF